ncbi:MAG: hypothetical protein KAW12_09170 [Candidatus Aminicenantes bacterium]|nr:hypothetical protein [Candidatus Aminicenantes bacterium]
MKKNLITVLVFLVLSGFLIAEEKKTLLKLPVRVLARAEQQKDLQKENFKLYINGAEREISEFFPKSRSIKSVETKRNFILVFNLIDYDQKTANLISYFVEKVLREEDKLIIWSPLNKINLIDPRSNKQKIAAGIQKMIKEDCLAFKNNLKTAKQNFADAKTLLRLNPTSIKYFIKNYSLAFQDFKTRFLLPDLKSFYRVASLLVGEKGGKWLINFQQQGLILSKQDYRAAKKEIEKYLSNPKNTGKKWYVPLLNDFKAMDKAMDIDASYPFDTILDFMLGLNISYNLVLLRVPGNSPDPVDTLFPGYDSIPAEIAGVTGGGVFGETDLTAGLKAVAGRVDYYYELIFKFNGKLEEKNIRVKVTNPEAELSHRSKFPEEEIKALVEITAEKGVNISGYKLEGYRLSFSITGFKMEKGEQTGNRGAGLVQVEIKLIDDRNSVIYNTGKTLKSPGKSIDISLDLPRKHKGYYKLSVEAIDRISGRNAQLSEYIELK